MVVNPNLLHEMEMERTLATLLSLSSSNIIFWIVTLILLFTHQMDFAP